MKINLADPGPTRTGLRAKAMPGESPDNLPAPSEVAVDLLDLIKTDVFRTGALYDRVSGEWMDLR